MEEIILYTDGSVLHNHSIGGYAAVRMLDPHTPDYANMIVGAKASSSIQEMELLGVIAAIESVDCGARVTVFTDHKTICDVVAKPNRSKCEFGEFRRLWHKLRKLCKTRTVSLQWVRGHCDDFANSIADRAAQRAARRFLLKPQSL